jgi:hypothetical protein
MLITSFFKTVITSMICIGILAYILSNKKRVRGLHLVAFSFIFQAIGYWWLDTWIGEPFIWGGFGLLVYGIFKRDDSVFGSG